MLAEATQITQDIPLTRLPAAFTVAVCVLCVGLLAWAMWYAGRCDKNRREP